MMLVVVDDGDGFGSSWVAADGGWLAGWRRGTCKPSSFALSKVCVLELSREVFTG
jgi:hypothetical protein